MSGVQGAGAEARIDFEGLAIRTDPQVLTPRAWTAAQSRWTAELARSAPSGPILEICAGAGHMGLLASRLSGRGLVAVDLNPAAGDLIAVNAASAGLEVDVRVGDMESVLAVDELFPVILADPPWVRSLEVSVFPEDPVSAIDGGPDGLQLVEACLRVIHGHLQVDGSAVLQVGPEQAEATTDAVADLEGLAVREVRAFPRGCLVRLDRVGAGPSQDVS